MARAEQDAVTEALSPDEIEELNRLLGKLAKVASPDRALW